jgi:tRNA-uridine 2-sulfurtransferase
MIEVTGDSARGEDWAFVRLRIDGERIVDADADGLDTGLAGLTLLEAAAVAGETLTVDALANALAPVFRAPPSASRTAVAMSGGVDSAVALLRAGPEAVGVTLRLWLDPDGPDSTRACCSPDAVLSAREGCHSLGLPHVTLDLRREFKERVVEQFVSGYADGQTPNPCIRCNGEFRFDELVAFAERAGAARLATGHYARIVEHGGRLLLACAADARKDQSYMLGRVNPELLDRLWFPLGEQTKIQTRAEAERAGLACAHREESQEACFLAGADYRDFLERAGLPQEQGAVVDEDGAELGAHAGFWRFTPGQRRGLGVASGSPLHVLRTDPATNTVVAGPREALGCSTVQVSGELYVPVDRVEAKLRYRSPAFAADVRPTDEGFELELDEPAEAVAPGQAAVLYERETVVGAGTITAASR